MPNLFRYFQNFIKKELPKQLFLLNIFLNGFFESVEAGLKKSSPILCSDKFVFACFAQNDRVFIGLIIPRMVADEKVNPLG